MKKFLIVLDLNGTLLHRLTKKAEILAARLHPKHRPADHKLPTTKQPVYLRPYLEKFLNILGRDERTEVAVWTSAMEKNANAMVHCLNNQNNEFKFIWGQNCCTFTLQPGKHKPLFQKPLSLVIQEYPTLSKENILIIDDSQEKFLEEDRENHLCIPEFNVCDLTVDFTLDTVLSVLADWFSSLLIDIKQEESLVSFLKQNPPSFTPTPATTDISDLIGNLKVL